MRTLHTSRLVLRPPRRSDTPVLARLRPLASGEGDASGRVAAWIALAPSAPAGEHGGWVVALRKDRAPIGVLLYGRETSDRPVAELTIEIDGPFRGNGYGREALRRAMRFLTTEGRFAALSAYIATSNAASEQLFASLGFQSAPSAILMSDAGETTPARRFAYEGEPGAGRAGG